MEGEGEGYSFVSSNNTIVYSFVRKIEDGVRMNEGYSNRNFTSRISLSDTSSHTFTNCTFTNCTSSGNGGAISFSSSTTTTYTLTITSCTFTNCSANLHAGAVYCCNASSCVVSGCSFVNCNSCYGGCTYMYYISTCVGVKDSNISACTAMVVEETFHIVM